MNRTSIGRFAPNFNNYRYKHLTRELYEKFGDMTQISEELGWSSSAIKNALRGDTQPRKDFIDTILAATGETYEQAFQEDYE